MGGSKTYSTSKLSRGGKVPGSEGSKGKVIEAVSSDVQEKIIAQTLSAVISYYTPLNSLIYGLKFIKLAYEIYSAYQKKYEETGDENEALKSATKVVINKAIDKLAKEGVKLAVSEYVNQSNIKMEDSTKTLLINSLSGAIEKTIK